MKSFWRICGILLFMLSCSPTAWGSDKEYYTQFNVWIFKDRVSTDNFGIERLIPVNSKARIVKVKEYEAELQVGDVNFNLLINRSHMHKSSVEFLRLYLRNAPVDLRQFSTLAQNAIQVGDVRVGMSKDEVIVARGYPPENATENTESNSWTYWQNRWHSIVVQFEDGKVSNIKDGSGKWLLKM